MSPGNGKATLRPDDVARFVALGIEPRILETAGVRRVSHDEARALGVTYKSDHLEGIAFPYILPTTAQIVAHRVRRDHPEIEKDKPRNKYLSTTYDRRHLYFPPGCAPLLADTTVPVVPVEAEKSVLAVVSASQRIGRRVLPFATGGCWGWRGIIGKAVDPTGARVDEKGALGDLNLITWSGRSVVVLFDSNAATNPKVHAARRAFVQELCGRGADVRVGELPIEDGINGPDDYIGKHGDAAFFALLDAAKVDAHGASARRISLTPASSIRIRPVRWFWQDRVALGTLALLGGREGIGKTILVYTIGAQATRGTLPGVYYGHPHNIIVAATEDSWAHTIVPRLMAAGADLNRVFRVDVRTTDGVDTGLSLPRDLRDLQRVVREAQASLIILDPLLSRLDSTLDSHKDAEVRQALEPLVTLADASEACILGLIHCNKGASTDALTMLMGSRAFAAVARSVLFVAIDPDDDKQRILGQPKNNLGAIDLPSLTFRINGAHVATTDEGEVWTGKLEWTGTTDRSIGETLAAAAESAGDRTMTDEAADWLADYLSDGTRDSASILAAGQRAGHARSALQRARKKLRIQTESRGFPRKTYWALPTHPPVVSLPGETTQVEMNETTAANCDFLKRPVVPVVSVVSSETDPPRVKQQGGSNGRLVL